MSDFVIGDLQYFLNVFQACRALWVSDDCYAPAVGMEAVQTVFPSVDKFRSCTPAVCSLVARLTLAEHIHQRRWVDTLWHTLAAYFQQDICIVDKSLDIQSVKTVADLRQMLLRPEGGHISYRLVQRAFVKAGWHNQSCLAVDKVVQQLVVCTVGTLSLDDAAAVDSSLDVVAVEGNLVHQRADY